MILYSVRRRKWRSYLNHSASVRQIWPLSILLHDKFSYISSKSLWKHLPLNCHLNSQIIHAYVVRASWNLALPSLGTFLGWMVYWWVYLSALVVDGRLWWIYLDVDQRKFALPIHLSSVIECLVVVFNVYISGFFKPLCRWTDRLIEVRWCYFLIIFSSMAIEFDPRWHLWLSHL